MNENVRDFFNQVAVNYSHDDSQLIDDLLDSLFVTRCHRILDLGCGKGIISEKLASRNNGEVVALDLSSEMLKYAKEKINDERVKFVNGDFYQYDDEPFDAIICFDAFPHFLDVAGFVEKANQLLKSDGLLAIIHDCGRKELNTHHKQHALGVSRQLSIPEEEVKPFLKYFKPIELSEDDTFYKLLVIKKEKTKYNYINGDIEIDFELSKTLQDLVNKAEAADHADDYGTYMNYAYAIDSQGKNETTHRKMRERQWNKLVQRYRM